MDNCLFHPKTSVVQFSPFALKPQKFSSLNSRQVPLSPRNLPSSFSLKYGESLRRRAPIVGATNCEFSSLNTPIEPQSVAGKFLSSVVQDQPQLFTLVAEEEIKRLADIRDAARARMNLESDSDEACLHRRIAELKDHESQHAIEDVIYMMIFYQFSKLKVPLVPNLSKCIYNGRLEIWPSKDWELESVHSSDVLEMVRKHVTAVIGLKANSSVVDLWATTKIPKFKLGRIYKLSIIFGYLLKSVSSRHHLEECLAPSHQDHNHSHQASLNLSDNQSTSCEESSLVKHGRLSSHLKEFDVKTLTGCTKLKSIEAKSLVEKHCYLLFGEDKMGLIDTDEVILTSFSSLKRFVLEAVAFGLFLSDAEDYVSSRYKLEEN